ncbi:MAG: DMT family transporter [Lachnospiraceae bacterium]|nr:DMT family transporter [Lachnospiraceae bacterium]MCM1235042.1 DMT family transporter [Ruminococcus flavefaciens]
MTHTMKEKQAEWLLAIRFSLAFILLSLVFHKKLQKLNRQTILHGAILGGLFFLVMIFEAAALTTTDTSTTSFLENTAIIFVPIIKAILCQKMPSRSSIFSVLLAISGVALLTLSGSQFHLTKGELLCIAAAIFYACAIIATDHFSHIGDSILLGIFEIGFLGLFALCGSFVSGSFTIPVSMKEYASLAVLVIICSGFGFTLQPMAQSHMSTERAGLFCALNPAFASLLGIFILHEHFTMQRLIGALLILSSLFLPKLISSKSTSESAPT